MNRPPLMWSIVRAMSASRFGLRYELQVTSAPICACARVGGHRREQRVRLEVRGVGVAVERVEVIPDPDAVDLERVGGLPRRPQLLDARRLGMELNANFESGHAPDATGPRKLDPAPAVAQSQRRLTGQKTLERLADKVGAPARGEAARAALQHLGELGPGGEQGGVEIELGGSLREPRAEDRDRGRERTVDAIRLGQPQLRRPGARGRR